MSQPQPPADAAAAAAPEGATPSAASAGQPAEIASASWFAHLAGVDEADFHAQGALLCVPSRHAASRGPRLQLRNARTGRCYEAGRFRPVSIAELERAAQRVRPLVASATSPPASQCPLHVVCREDRESVAFVDVGVLQAARENRLAVFQAASNFNAVEAIDEDAHPDDPNFTSNYIFDRTQGPQASLGAGAAAITRVHAAFAPASATSGAPPPEEWRQTSDHQVELLGGLRDYYTVQNGYVCLTGSEKPLPASKEERDKLLRRVCVGLHTEVEVTFAGYSGENLRVVERESAAPDASLGDVQLIDQVFCAAMNVKQGESGEQNARAADCLEKATFLLRAAYRATYLAALVNKRQRLFLTLIGGGVFGNPVKDVFDIILEEHRHWTSKPYSRLSEVVLVLYSVPEEVHEWANQLDRDGVPYCWTAYSKGVGRVYRGKPIPPSVPRS
eukprot:m51a1_g5102 hypothetical protein (446) ;mRNA; f:300273-301994